MNPPYKPGDVATAPNGATYTRSDNDGLWFRDDPNGTTPLDDGIVEGLGLTVTRKGEPPAFIMAKFRTCHGAEPHVMEFEVEYDDCGIGNYAEGHLIAHDTPENRRLLSLKIVAEGEIGRDEDKDATVNGVWCDRWLQSNTKPGHTLLIVEEQP